jgi:DNA-directed RNA polymerase specialized sigma24 family protein
MHTTPPTLLERVRDTLDDKAWGRLVELYTPLLFAWARRCGASEHDAADLVREVFVAAPWPSARSRKNCPTSPSSSGRRNISGRWPGVPCG